MKNRQKYIKFFLITILTLTVLIHIIPIFIDGNQFKNKICEEVSKNTNLVADIKKIKLSSALFFKAKVTLEEPLLKTKDGQDVFYSEKTSVSIDLLPLLFKKVQLSDIELIEPSVYLTKKKNGKFEFEPDDSSSFTPMQQAEQNFQIALDGMNILVKDYKLKYLDKSLYPLADAKVKGNKIIIKNYNAKSGTTFCIDGAMAINNQRCLNYDIKSNINLPEFLAYQKKHVAITKKEQNSFNSLEQIYKNNLKADIKADLQIKTIENINGWLNIDKFSMKVSGDKLPDSFCHIKAQKNKFVADSKIFVSDKSFISLNGEFKDSFLDFSLKIPQMQLDEVERFSKTILKIAGASIKEMELFKTRGELVCDMKMKTNLKNIKSTGYLKLNNAEIDCCKGLVIIKNLNSDIKLNNNNVIISNTKGMVDGNNFDVSGKIDSHANTDITISAPDINLLSITNNPNFKEQMNSIADIQGKINASIKLSGKLSKLNYTGAIIFENGVLKLKELPLKISFPFAKIDMSSKENFVTIPSCLVNSSKFTLKGIIPNDEIEKMNFILKGRLVAADVSDVAGISNLGKGTVPVLAKMKYENKTPKIQAQILNNKNNNLIFEGLSGNNVLNFDILLQNDKISFQDTALYKTSVEKLLEDMSANIKNSSKIATLTGAVNAKNGNLDNIKIKVLSPIKLALPVGTGATTQLLGDAIVQGKINNPQIRGDFILQNTSIPEIKGHIEKATISFKNKKIVANMTNFQSGKSDMNIYLIADGGSFAPVTIENIQINSNFFDADELLSLSSKLLPSAPKKKVEYSLKKSNTMHFSPVIIKNGKFTSKTFVINKIPCNNLITPISLNKYNIFSAGNISTATMKGTMTGDVNSDLAIGTTSCNFKARNVSVTDFSRYFLGTNLGPCTGVASSDIKIKFSGASPDEILRSLEGNAIINAKNGEMGNLGRLDYYLRAANIVSNNLVAVSLNKIINGIKLKRTGEYGKAYGAITFKKGGIMHIDYFKTEGPRLSLYMNGYINNLNLDASLNIFGRMSAEMVDALGPIGDFSIQDAIKKVSFLNSLTQYTVGLLEADVSEAQRKQIPPLTVSGANSQEFTSRIAGDLTRPSSVKSFRWIRTGSDL